jgi:hypothetical protein
VTDVHALKSTLEADVDGLARHLLPQGKRAGREWRCSGSDSPTGAAISVVLSGSKRGVVGFFGGHHREGGDLLELIQVCERTDFKGAVAWAQLYLGRAFRDAPARACAAHQNRERDKREERDAAMRHSKAKAIWCQTQPIAGTLGEEYLLGRDLSTRQWSPALRFHPALEWTPGASVEPQDGKRFVHQRGPLHPAIVCAVQQADGRATAIWRIYLEADGSKLERAPNKMGLGSAKGGAVRLGTFKPVIGVAEGVETGLAVQEIVKDELPIWAALSTSGMRTLELPPEVEEVRIFPDGDLPKRRADGTWAPAPGMSAAEALRNRLKGKVRVHIEPVPANGDYLDIVGALRCW